MKKVLTLLVSICMLLTLAACGGGDTTPEVKEATYKLGMGTVVNPGSKTGTAQIDTTVAVVVLDANGVIVDCVLDVAQNKVKVEEGVINTDVDFRTKMEKLGDYNMKPVSAIGKEWYEQAEGFCEFVTGKTAAEVAALETVVSNGHNVAVDETLHALCSMDITAFKAAVAAACADDQGKEFTVAADAELKTGLAMNSWLEYGWGGCADATDEKDGTAAIYTDYSCAVTVDGKIVAALTDAIQPKVTFTTEGECTDPEVTKTKRVKLDEYGMRSSSEIGKEWYEQAASFTDYVVGMTAAEVAAIETRTRTEEEAHPGYVVAVDEALVSQCSIQITSMMSLVSAAAK